MGALLSCGIQPHRVHCEVPFSRLTNTSFLQFGQFNLTSRTERMRVCLYQSDF